MRYDDIKDMSYVIDQKVYILDYHTALCAANPSI